VQPAFTPKCFQVVEIAEARPEAPLAGQGVEGPVAAAVAIVRSDDEIVGAQQVRHEHHGGHPGVGDHCARATLQFGQGVAELVPGGVTATGVIVGSGLPQSFEAVI
jgi:hypothetical protein